MNERDVRIKIAVDTAGLEQGLGKAQAELRQTGTAMEGGAGGGEKLEAALATISTRLVAVEQGLRQLQAVQRQATPAMAAQADETKRLDDRLAAMMSRLDPVYRAEVQLAQGVALLDANLEAGNISAARHAEMLAKVEAAYGPAANGAQRVGNAHGMAVWQVQAMTHAVRASVDQMMAGGNAATVLGMQTFQLAGVLGGTSLALFGYVTAAAAVAAPLALGTARAEAAAREHAALATALQATGRAGLVSAQDLDVIINRLASMPGVSRTAAGEIVTEFARSRQVGGALFAELTGIVDDFAVATGRKAPDAAKVLAQAFADPAEGAKRLDKELGILSASQLLAIERFDRLGDRAQAQGVLLDALKGRVKGLAEDGVTPLEQASDNLAKSWDRMLESLSKTSGIQAARQALAGLFSDLAVLMGNKQAELDGLKRSLAELEALRSNPAAWGGADASKTLDWQISGVKDRIAKLEAELGGQRGASTQAGGSSVASQPAQVGGGTASAGQESESVKETLAATRDLAGVEERRAELKDRIARIQESLKTATGQEADILQGRMAEAQRQLADMKGKGDASRVEAWRQELEQIKTAEGGFLDFSKTRELEFWQSKLATLRRGSADYAQVYKEVYTLQRVIAKEDLDKQVADLKNQMEERKKDGSERIRLAQEIARLEGEAYGQESVQYKQAMRGVEQAQREHAEEMRRLKAMEIDATQAHGLSGLEMRRDELRFQREMGQISSREEVQRLRDLANQEYEIQRQALQDKLQLQNLEVQERQRLNNQLMALEDRHRQQMAQSQQQEALAVKQTWQSAFQPVTSAFQSSVTGMIMQTTTLQKAVANMAQSIIGEFVAMGVRMLAEWVAAKLGMSAVSSAQAAEEVATTTTAAATSTVAAQTSAVMGVMAYAAEGAAAAGASVAAIPVVGWAMAPGVAAETYGMLMAFAPLASAAGGWDEVDRDQLAMIHKREMVLSAPIADKIRALPDNSAAAPATSPQTMGTSQPTAGGDIHLHVNAVDAKSFSRMLRNSRSDLSRVLQDARRDFTIRGDA